MAFWMPSEASVTEEVIVQRLRSIEVETEAAEAGLVLERVTREELSGRLWRWLCVYYKTSNKAS